MPRMCGRAGSLMARNTLSQRPSETMLEFVSLEARDRSRAAVSRLPFLAAVLLAWVTVPIGSERLRLAVTSGQTASAGLAVRHAGEPLESVLGRADHALYDDKAYGRDHVRAAA